ncbi:hypothetical protein [Stygiolobus caldivivus]|uniref:Uncharacterized protein n=1 Tax=Stygiolobus caldivivus TaxID=2824673 RepID=A0A8D5ZKR7_9CREN|nr:hypothetical protein [Stygiolobus caldivivus]BCU71552.1 hypothetical protein KN1_28490 [Stygiolobus caldivivus]
MSEVDPCFLAWVYLLEKINKKEDGNEEGKEGKNGGSQFSP